MKRRTLQKSLLLILLPLLVAAVSAAVYNLMHIQAPTISAEPAKVKFVEAADSAVAGVSIGTNGTYVSIDSMAGWPGATRVYEAVVGIKNFDTADRTINLAFNSWSGSTSNIDYIYVKIVDANGVQQGSTITVGAVGSSSGPLSIPAGATWYLRWEIKWKAGALSTDVVSVTLLLTVAGE
mgnify:CR=1 FL=1